MKNIVKIEYVNEKRIILKRFISSDIVRILLLKTISKYPIEKKISK